MQVGRSAALKLLQSELVGRDGFCVQVFTQSISLSALLMCVELIVILCRRAARAYLCLVPRNGNLLREKNVCSLLLNDEHRVAQICLLYSSHLFINLLHHSLSEATQNNRLVPARSISSEVARSGGRRAIVGYIRTQ